MHPTRELSPETWADYLNGITEELRNQPVSIEIVDPDTPPVFEAKRLALQMLTYDRRDDVFEVAAAQGGPRLPSVLRHLVDHPTRIEVDSPATLAPTRIIVDARDGVRTVIKILGEGAFAG